MAQRFEDVLGGAGGVAAQGFGQIHRVLVAAQAEHVAVELLDGFLEHPAHPDDELIALAVAEVVVDVLEVVDVHEQHRADIAGLQCLLQRALQAHPVGQPGERIVRGEVLDLQRRFVLLGDIAGGAADADDQAVVIVLRRGR